MILLLFGSVAGMEVPGIIKKKQWRELTVYLSVFILGLLITTLHQVFKVDFSVITVWFIKVFGLWG
jgi:hypothetical protein